MYIPMWCIVFVLLAVFAPEVLALAGVMIIGAVKLVFKAAWRILCAIAWLIAAPFKGLGWLVGAAAERVFVPLGVALIPLLRLLLRILRPFVILADVAYEPFGLASKKTGLPAFRIAMLAICFGMTSVVPRELGAAMGICGFFFLMTLLWLPWKINVGVMANSLDSTLQALASSTPHTPRSP